MFLCVHKKECMFLAAQTSCEGSTKAS